MIPAAFVRLDRLPLTPNGKLDRKALPSPDAEQLRRDTAYTPPQTPEEQILADVWAQVLGMPRVGRDDNFLDLGGHSLAAAQVRSRLSAQFGLDVPFRDIFDAPDLASLANGITGHRPETEPAVQRLRPGDESGVSPLSFTQQQLWFLEHLVPGTPAYTSHVALRVTGPLRIRDLERSLNTVVARHDVLLTRIVTEFGQPRQIMAAHQTVPVQVIDLTDRPAAERAAAARELATKVVRSTFDLGEGPLLRAVAIRCAEDDHLLILAGHHIAFDGWAFRVLFEELAAGYAAGPPVAEPEPPIQYSDFVRWQRLLAKSPAMEEHLAYWRDQLADATRLLGLPLDRPRPAVQSFRGATRTFMVPPALHQALVRKSREENSTLFMLLLAAYTVLLARHSGQDDILVGTPVANRGRPEFEDLIGFFANTLALRTDLSGDPTFREVIARVRRACLDAYSHQDAPFELVIDTLRPDREAGHNPIFQVLFALQNVGVADVTLPGVELTHLDLDPGTSRFDLAFSLEETADGLRCSVEYSTDLFAASTVERLVDHYRLLLEAMVTDPDQHVGRMSLLTPEEHQRLAAWNDTAADYPDDRCLHQLITAQARRTPDAVALVCGDRQFSYAALDSWANRMAQMLREDGVGPEVAVGVFLERSCESIVSLLAVFKAGGVYVPLDPAYPAERLAFMLADSDAAVVITTRSLLAALPPDAKVICVDRDAERIARTSSAEPPVDVFPDNLGYLIYTSGSTGRPKGALMAHRGLANLVVAEAEVIRPAADDRVLQLASFSFDASLWDVVMALAFGGTLCLATGEQRLPGPQLAALLVEQAITHATLAPSALAVLLPEAAPYLKLLTSTGEAVTADVVRRWAPGRRFINGYGPTETTVGATMGECRSDDIQPHLGRPFSNTRVHLLDQNLLQVPLGVPGEVYIGGPGLSRGYRYRQGLTAERFVPDPFSEEPGARLYRTGDRARRLSDGTLVFLGRTDHQVQIRGFRVELGEVETVLRSHPHVTDATVIHTNQLIAYVVTDLTTTELRAHCSRDLPDHMIPTTFVTLDRLPLTPNGKVDHKNLPAPTQHSNTPYAPPRTPAEHTLATIWAQVLGVPQVGRDDNFFALGGDSILTIQVIARAAQHGITLTPPQLFRHQTIATLAPTLTPTTPTTAPQNPITGPVHPTAIQRWFLNQKLPNPHHYNQALLLQAHHSLDTQALDAALHALHTHHDTLRLRIHNGVLDNAPPSDTPPALLTTDIQSDFDLSSGQLLRALYIAHQQQLLLITHHLATDGVSWRILLEDLTTAYHQAATDQPIQLPPKTTSYQAWAQHQATHHQADFPYVHVAPEVNTYGNAETYVRTLDVDLTQAVLRPGRHTSTQNLLLTALGRTLTAWTGEERVEVDVEGHGRDSAPEGMDLSRTVGWFTTINRVTLDAADGQPVFTPSSELHGQPVPEVCFNYLGQFDTSLDPEAPWHLVPELPAGSQDGRQPRPYPLEINALVVGGRLQVRWGYVPALQEHEAVVRLAEQFDAEIEALVNAAGDVEDIYPLTPLQQGMHFHSIYEPDSSVYVVQLAVRFEGPLDTAAFRSAWDQLVRRHAVLRASFHHLSQEQPLQKIHRRISPPWLEQDWRTLDDERETRLASLQRAERARGFDLTQPPLMRFALVRLTEDSHQFLWTHHHLLLDGWSLPIILKDLYALYEAELTGRQADLPPTRPFRDFVDWLQAGTPPDAESVWREALAGFTAPTPLPLGAPATSATDPRMVELTLPADLSDALQQVCRTHGLTLSTVVQGVWGVLLGRHGGVRDVVFGVTVAGRPAGLSGVERMVGL
ncbi:MAG: non-ribosomal peptide synthase, partial [Actinomycetia bacterium]|nr:non-ribosomal peptide synthase [Actinomycetes bacterium]